MTTQNTAFAAAARTEIEKRMTDEEAAVIETEAAATGDVAALAPEDEPAPAENEHEIPEWVVLPSGLKLPPGRQLYFALLRAEWTDTPGKGARQCVMWKLTDADEKVALKRTRGDGTRALAELTKQTIRAIDGVKVDWTRGELSNINRWWDEIGAGCRQMLQGLYHKNHNLTLEQQADFFANCVVVRTAAAG